MVHINTSNIVCRQAGTNSAYLIEYLGVKEDPAGGHTGPINHLRRADIRLRFNLEPVEVNANTNPNPLGAAARRVCGIIG